ncbi:MAG: radical SAM protein, partial [Candidatus Cloacimonadota bacterium]
CPFQCIYCNQNTITKTKSVDFHSLSVLVENFCKNNSAFADKEIAFYGGTFTAVEKNIQKKLFSLVKPFFSEIKGIRISTRPDAIDDEILSFLQKNKVRTVELGIQSFSDSVLSASARGYSKAKAIDACKKIKSANFKLGIQLMPGLPGFSPETQKETLAETIFLSPDFVRIYPTIVLKDTKLEKLFRRGSYEPLSIEQAVEIVAAMKSEFEENRITVIKTGLHSDIEKEEIVAGPFHPAFGELVNAEILRTKIEEKFRKNLTLVISSRDVSLFKGFSERMLRKLKSNLKIDKIPICVDANLPGNKFSFQKIPEEFFW